MSLSFPSGSDVILRHKNEHNVESIIFPVTRYQNIMSSPKVIDDISNARKAPFVLLNTDSVALTITEINELFNIQ